MQILHDWDRTVIEGGWAKKRALTLFLYCLSRKFPILLRLKSFRENAQKVEAEQLAYMETLIKLGELCGVTPIFGLRDCIMEKYGKPISELAIKYDVDVRRHIHIGDPPDENRVRVWIPPLFQRRETWGFGLKYSRGERVILKEGELAIWHVDRPHFLALYIDYLHEIIVEDRK